ncbi:MAG: hypothetical protein LBH04_02590 [Tannerellaceae bacterium]|nr:hypothetical protein [Tannerellaceae bacterium]
MPDNTPAAPNPTHHNHINISPTKHTTQPPHPLNKTTNPTFTHSTPSP